MLLLILLILALRLPLLVIGLPLTLPELKFMVIGERMANGFSMYSEIYDYTSPLSAATFWLIDELFNRSQLAYQLFALILVLIQGFRFNAILNGSNLLGEKSFIPALIYLVSSCIFFELDTLSPVLIGNTFIIFSLRYFISFSKEGYNNKKLFKAGFMMGLAALCFLPFVVFLLVGFFAIVLYASSAFRSFLLMLCGFLFTYAVAMTYYLYTDTLPQFILYNLFISWEPEFDFLLKPADLAKIFAAPFILLLLGILKLPTVTLGLNLQQRFLQLMFIWLITSILIVFASKIISGSSFVLFLPIISYFGYFLFNRRKRKWIADVMFLVFMAAVLFFRYHEPANFKAITNIDIQPILVPEAHDYPQVSGQQVVVLGDDISFYKDNELATPYLNWQSSRRYFNELEYYSSVYQIYHNFTKETPTYIIDQAGVIPDLKDKLPGTFNQYQLVQPPSLYKLVK